MDRVTERLRQYQSPTPSKWREEAEERQANSSWLKHSRKIALKMLGKMNDEGITQSQLAERMGCKQQQISKILKGRENLTLETLSRIEGALDIRLL
ncbi:MAG: helix-turn-helix transcriptional regulator [Bacteroides sp.]|nr:helix-turn-helix transcriptional regulator [Bacteroides sp.]